MEPAEGDYRFDWLERAIEEAGQHGIYTVLGTPTAAPPAWLTQKYPETLRMEEDGLEREHGNRQQFNWDNPKYRELARESPADGAALWPQSLRYRAGRSTMSMPRYRSIRNPPDFQAWVKDRYGTLDNLNARWTTSYWSQTYSNWNQIPIETTEAILACC